MRRSPPQDRHHLRRFVARPGYLKVRCSTRIPLPAIDEAADLSLWSGPEGGQCFARGSYFHCNDGSILLKPLPALRAIKVRHLASPGRPAVDWPPPGLMPAMVAMDQPLPALDCGGERTVVAAVEALLGEPFRFGPPLLDQNRITIRWSGPGQRALLGR